MHVAVDAHDLVRDRRGIGRYLRAVLARMLSRADLRVTLVLRDAIPWRRSRPFAEILGVQAVRVALAVPRDADVVWHPWNGTFVRSAHPSVATVHDLAPFAFPADEPRAREHEQAPFRRTVATARRIVADSAFTRAELERRLGVDPAKVTVVPLGVDAQFCPGSLEALPPILEDVRYVLHVGTHETRKNLGTLVAAHERAFPRGEVKLVLTREPPRGLRDALVFEDVGPERLVALYRGASLVAVPSTYEGFGLPVLEAMACGAPVVASRAASLPEVGGDAVRWVEDPLDVEGWATALREVAGEDEVRAALRQRGFARAATFTWERCTEGTLDVLREVAVTA